MSESVQGTVTFCYVIIGTYEIHNCKQTLSCSDDDDDDGDEEYKCWKSKNLKWINIYLFVIG